ncbi:MAG: MBL fold metallo-hydrolase [Chloroflexota bacterium]
MSQVTKQFSYDPEEIAPDLYAIPLPLYDGSPVNAYVALENRTAWLIDGGLGTAECQAILARGLAALGYDIKDVAGLIVTHSHTDHVGAAQTVRAQGGEILAHKLETGSGRDMGFDEDWLIGHGMPADQRSDTPWHTIDWPEPTRTIEDGDLIRWGPLDLEVLWCPGHTRGLVCLWDARRGILFTTDHVMRRAPSPVTLRRPDDTGDPLADYLQSLERLRDLPVRLVLPGHGRPFAQLRDRLDDIAARISAQLDKVAGMVDQAGATTAYDLLALTGFRDPRGMAARYDLGQMLARLRFLENRNRIRSLDRSQVVRFAGYSAAGSSYHAQ